MKILPLIMIVSMLSCGCTALLDTKKDLVIAEDIVDDVVKEETGFDLKLSPSDK